MKNAGVLVLAMVAPFILYVVHWVHNVWVANNVVMDALISRY